MQERSRRPGRAVSRFWGTGRKPITVPFLELFERLQRRLLAGLQRQPLLKQRIERLQSIRGVGEVGAELGAGDGRSRTLFVDPPGGELLRAVRGATGIGRQALSRAAVEAAQQTPAASLDRGGQAGTALEPAIAPSAGPRTRARPCWRWIAAANRLSKHRRPPEAAREEFP